MLKSYFKIVFTQKLKPSLYENIAIETLTLHKKKSQPIYATKKNR